MLSDDATGDPCGAQSRVVVIDKGYGTYDYERQVLEPAGYQLDIFRGSRYDREGRIAICQGAVGILMRWTPIDGAFLDRVPSVKAIARYGVGYEHIDVQACTDRGVKVAIVNNYGNHSVSDHALALMLSCARALPLGERHFEATTGFPPRLDMKEFAQCTLGIIGLGRIGGTLSRKAQSLFKRIIAYDPYVSSDKFIRDGAEPCSFDTLLAESDIISVHCNQTAETRGMLNWEAFLRMKRQPIIVNTARGPIIDEEALLDALREELVHSAGLDVFSVEPPFPMLEPLRKHPKVLATSHYAYYSDQALPAVQTGAARNLLAMLRGETIEDCLNS